MRRRHLAPLHTPLDARHRAATNHQPTTNTRKQKQLMATAAPAESSGFSFEDHKGDLLLIVPTSRQEGIATTFGDKSAIGGYIAVLDGEHKGDVYDDTLIFPLVLQGQLKSYVEANARAIANGKTVLDEAVTQVVGRLIQGVAKPGQKPPWKIDNPTEGDLETAGKYIAYVAEQTKEEAPF
jgi:hypothetical protein